MNDELREAMETVEAALVPGSPLTPSAECAAWTLAKAYLDERDNVSPPDLSFASVNEFVHQTDANYEYLQWLCLSLAMALDANSDDAEPVTEEWLLTNGWENVPSGIHRWMRGVGVTFNGESVTINGIDVGHLRTRGDVRRLCRALGIELKETPA